jgi:hypothetical protein
MTYKGLPEHLVARIKPADARAYATASGWVRGPTVNGKVAVFNHPDLDLDQLLIPIDPNLSDFPERMADVVASLAEHQKRTAPEVLNDLLLPASDVLRFRLDEPEAQSGALPLEQGIELLQGARKAVLSAACSVVQPQTFHPRLSRTEAEQLLQACRLGQTERGSFTVVIACPLDAVGPIQALRTDQRTLFEHLDPVEVWGSAGENAPDAVPEPFTRKATGLLMRSIARIVAAVDADRVETLLETGADQPSLSANLCESLLMMQPNGDRSRLSVLASWARTYPPSPGQAAPSVVNLRRDYFPTIERLAVALRPARASKTAYFVGLVDALFGTPDEANRVSGEVQVLLFNQEGPQKARVNLNADDYHVAWEAHGQGGYVSLHGILNLGQRVHRIESVSSFKLLKE